LLPTTRLITHKHLELVMKITITTGIAALCMGTGLYGLAMAGPFEDGIDAARRADYEIVLRLWRPLAEQGDAKAQTALARLYAQGRGVPRDYTAAMSWYRKAAAQGDDEAQEALARLYADNHRAAAELSRTLGQKERTNSDREPRGCCAQQAPRISSSQQGAKLSAGRQ
jgi:TPR repeat protein